tara:strand:+ start:327 stop:1148 length:822 start_codon:yes stop_codon:yes gene_type:complete
MALTKIQGKGIEDIDLSVAGELEVSSATGDSTDKRAFFVTKHYSSSEEDTAGVIIQSTDGDAIVDVGGNNTSGYNAVTKIRFYTAANNTTTTGSERMRITSGGVLLVGTTDTSPFNNTSGTGTSLSGGDVQIASSSSESLYLNRIGSDGRVVSIRKGGSFIGGIDVSTSQVTYNQTSDYRLKENVSYTWDATTRLKQLKPARFNYIVDADNTVDGFLAHEVEGIVPQAITGEKDAVDSDGNIDPQCIDHSKLVPLLVKTIQELEARIAALEAS